MTAVEELFRQEPKDKPIPYSEFAQCGWSPEKFVEYMSICEELRIYVLCMHSQGRYGGHINRQSNFEKRLMTLSDFLNPHLEEVLALKWNISLFQQRYYYGDDGKKYRIWEHPSRLIHYSTEDFRRDIEVELYYTITKIERSMPAFAWDEESLHTELQKQYEGKSDDDIREEIRRTQELVWANERPNYPTNMDDYTQWQMYARDYEKYYQTESLEYDIDSLKEFLEWRKKQKEEKWVEEEIEHFSEQNTVFVYRGKIKCHDVHHMIEFQAEVKPFEASITTKFHIEYCADCKKYLMKYADYQEYLERFHFFPLRVKMDTSLHEELERAEKSPLMLHGYSVSAKESLSAPGRQQILAYLIDHEIMSYRKILNYLEIFILQAEYRPSMAAAAQKWETDKEFVLSYRLNEKPNVVIQHIKLKK